MLSSKQGRAGDAGGELSNNIHLHVKSQASGSVPSDSVCMTFLEKAKQAHKLHPWLLVAGRGGSRLQGAQEAFVEGAHICQKESNFSLQIGAQCTFNNAD